MRTITISTDVFAKIWAIRHKGEGTEDEVLRRVLEVPTAPDTSSGAEPSAPMAEGGFRDPKSGVYFPEGFEIFRTYKGTEYRARATPGQWLLLNNNQRYPSLHKLSRAVVEGQENSWMNWKFDDGTGKPALIDKLRDPSKVLTRGPSISLDDF